MEETTTQEITALEQEVAQLKATLTGDMFADMETLDKIHNLEMSIKGVRPTDSFVECVGCGS